jgi:hypothetical protein
MVRGDTNHGEEKPTPTGADMRQRFCAWRICAKYYGKLFGIKQLENINL